MIQHRDIDATELIARIENVPFSRWHAKARIIVGSATFFDAFSALSLAFALPVLISVWNITPTQSGLLIGASYVGQLAGALLFSWQTMFLIGAIPGLVVAFLLARLSESPRWLISKGRLGEAEQIVRQMEAGTGHAVSTSGEVPVSSPGKVERSRWGEVLGRSYRSRTLIAWTLWATAYFITNSLNNWMPSLYNTVYHLGLRQSLRAASMTNVAQVLVLLICAFTIDRIGRKNWTAVAFIAGGTALTILGFVGAESVRSVMIFGTFSYGIIGSINAVLYLYTPEIYPTRMRAIGTGLATSWLRLASAVGPPLVGFMVGARGIDSVFLMFAATSV